MIGVRPAFGRAFRPEEEVPGTNHSVLLRVRERQRFFWLSLSWRATCRRAAPPVSIRR